jgi:hypothetical protein
MTTPTAATRTTHLPVDADILARWSPRAFDASALDEDTLHTLFEAARWAPSAYNAQPWRFVYALRDTPEWDELLSALLPFNAAWAGQASALFFILSDTQITPPGAKSPVPSGTHSFDAGAAWGLLALQAAKLGLHTHAMAGFDRTAPRRFWAAASSSTSRRLWPSGALAIRPACPKPCARAEVPSARLPLDEIAFRARLTQD